MRQYNLSSQYLDILVADFARPLWKPDIRFDAILTDRMQFIWVITVKL